MNRRDTLKRVGILLGTSLTVSQLAFHQGCWQVAENKDSILLTKEQDVIIDEITDTTIPDTGIPGAKGAGQFTIMRVSDCYPESVRKIFVRGINEVEKRAKANYNKSFVNIGQTQRVTLLQQFEREGKEQKLKNIEQGVKDVPPPYLV